MWGSSPRGRTFPHHPSSTPLPLRTLKDWNKNICLGVHVDGDDVEWGVRAYIQDGEILLFFLRGRTEGGVGRCSWKQKGGGISQPGRGRGAGEAASPWLSASFIPAPRL